MTSGLSTSNGPYLHDRRSVNTLMRDVLLALLPVYVALIWLYGIGILVNALLCSLACLSFEAAILRIRQRPVAPALKDCSALLTGLLIAVCLPPQIPFWLPLIAALFAIVFAKHLYGGLGYNLFNPAMVGFAVLLVSFPAYMGYWPPPDLSGIEQASAGIDLLLQGHLSVDAISSATPLDIVKTELGNMQTMPEIYTGELFNSFGPRGWVWVNIFALAGGLWLLVRKTIGWRIPTGVVLGLSLPALVAWIGDGNINPSPWFQLVSGGTLIGVFFIATDPVSSASTQRGQLVYGAGIGVLTYLIRTWGAYPDGFAFAVLLMNLAVPIIDRYTQPRIYGRAK